MDRLLFVEVDICRRHIFAGAHGNIPKEAISWAVKQISQPFRELKSYGTCSRTTMEWSWNSKHKGIRSTVCTPYQEHHGSLNAHQNLGKGPVDGLPSSNSTSELGHFCVWKALTALSLKDGKVRGKWPFPPFFYPLLKPISFLEDKSQ